MTNILSTDKRLDIIKEILFILYLYLMFNVM